MFELEIGQVVAQFGYDQPTVLDCKLIHERNEKLEWTEWFVESRVEDKFLTYFHESVRVGFGAVITKSIPYVGITVFEKRNLFRLWTEPNGQRMMQLIDSEVRRYRD